MNLREGSFLGRLVRRPTMKRLAGLFFLALLTARSGLALADENACLDGDTKMGPNCVHEDGRPGRDPMTTVYRVEDKKVSTVWTGVGTVQKSVADYLIVEELVDDGNGGARWAKVRHNWMGAAYEP